MMRSFIAAAILAAVASPAVAATPVPTSYRCFDAPAKVNYDKKHDRFYVHYAAERILMTRIPGAGVPTYINHKKNVMWELRDGRGVFSLLQAGTMTVDHPIANCVYKR